MGVAPAGGCGTCQPARCPMARLSQVLCCRSKACCKKGCSVRDRGSSEAPCPLLSNRAADASSVDEARVCTPRVKPWGGVGGASRAPLGTTAPRSLSCARVRRPGVPQPSSLCTFCGVSSGDAWRRGVELAGITALNVLGVFARRLSLLTVTTGQPCVLISVGHPDPRLRSPGFRGSAFSRLQSERTCHSRHASSSCRPASPRRHKQKAKHRAVGIRGGRPHSCSCVAV